MGNFWNGFGGVGLSAEAQGDNPALCLHDTIGELAQIAVGAKLISARNNGDMLGRIDGSLPERPPCHSVNLFAYSMEKCQVSGIATDLGEQCFAGKLCIIVYLGPRTPK